MANVDAGSITLYPIITYGRVSVIEDIPVLYGDVNLDGKITAADATMVLRYIVGLEELSDIQKRAADVTADGEITAADATMILRYIVGLEAKLGPQ